MEFCCFLRSPPPRWRRSSSQSWFHLRWVLSRRPPTAAHCLGCTTSPPGQTPQTAAASSPPSECCCFSTFTYFANFKWANITDCKCVALQQKRCRLKYFHSVNSSKVPNPMSSFRRPKSWTEKISRRPQNKNSVASIWALMYFSIQFAIQKELQYEK